MHLKTCIKRSMRCFCSHFSLVFLLLARGQHRTTINFDKWLCFTSKACRSQPKLHKVSWIFKCIFWGRQPSKNSVAMQGDNWRKSCAFCLTWLLVLVRLPEVGCYAYHEDYQRLTSAFRQSYVPVFPRCSTRPLVVTIDISLYMILAAVSNLTRLDFSCY